MSRDAPDGTGVHGSQQDQSGLYGPYDVETLPKDWPSLWLLLPDQPRAEITASRDAHASAARLEGWAILYLLLGTLWWPALPAAAVLFAIAWYRARATATDLAELIEAAVDLYIRDLARRLGLETDQPFGPRNGRVITDLLEKSSEAKPQPGGDDWDDRRDGDGRPAQPTA